MWINIGTSKKIWTRVFDSKIYVHVVLASRTYIFIRYCIHIAVYTNRRIENHLPNGDWWWFGISLYIRTACIYASSNRRQTLRLEHSHAYIEAIRTLFVRCQRRVRASKFVFVCVYVYVGVRCPNEFAPNVGMRLTLTMFELVNRVGFMVFLY